MFPADPVVEKVDRWWVLRDDLFFGGSKARVVPPLLVGADEFVYAGPTQGYAQLALAAACRQAGKQATLFLPARSALVPLSEEARRAGAKIVQIKPGYMTVLRARAATYCEMTGAQFIPLGLRLPGMDEAMAAYARSLPLPEPPAEVWVTAGTGTLAKACAAAWPDARINAVQVGAPPDLPAGAQLWKAPEAFHAPARGPAPPFPSAEFYDRKMWRFVLQHASPGAFVWNVGG